MNRNSTSSSQAKDRSRQIETRYEQCPLCGSRDIHLGHELLPITGSHGRKTSIKVRRWKCGNCGESYLTSESRRRLDEAMQVPTNGH